MVPVCPSYICSFGKLVGQLVQQCNGAALLQQTQYIVDELWLKNTYEPSGLQIQEIVGAKT